MFVVNNNFQQWWDVHIPINPCDHGASQPQVQHARTHGTSVSMAQGPGEKGQGTRQFFFKQSQTHGNFKAFQLHLNNQVPGVPSCMPSLIAGWFPAVTHHLRRRNGRRRTRARQEQMPILLLEGAAAPMGVMVILQNVPTV